MSQHLTPDLIAEALAGYDEIRSRDEATFVFDKHYGGGELRVTLYDADDEEVDCRTFRIVEVES